MIELAGAQAHPTGGATEGFVCPSCAGRACVQRFAGVAPASFVRCTNCEAELFWPAPGDEQLRAIYSERNTFSDQGEREAAAYLADPEPIRGWAASLGRQFGELGIAPGATVLELGCMYGMLLLELGRIGYDAWGIEPSPQGMAFLREHGGHGYQGTLFDADCPSTTCDVVMSFHTLEHLPDPYMALKKLRDMLRPGGVMHFVVPNWGGLVARRMQTRWKWFTYPEHLHYFSEQSIRNFMGSIGVNPTKIESTAGDHEAREVLEAFETSHRCASEDVTRLLQEILRNGLLGEALVVTAVRA